MCTRMGQRAGTDVIAAVAVGAAQLPSAWLLWWIGDLSDDRYGRGCNALGMIFVVLVAPVCLPVLGLLQAWAQTLPAAALAELTHGRIPWPRWVRHLTAAVLIAVVWAAVGTAAWGWPFVTPALVLAALGVLPVLAMAYTRGREWGAWGVWLGAGAGSIVLFVLAFLGGLLASATGLVEEYEPPRLSAAQVAGVWRGAGGAELRLFPGGRAELTNMPAEGDGDGDAEFEYGAGEAEAVCEGTGTWVFGADRESDRRDKVLVRLGDGSGTASRCGDEVSWRIGGADRAPELFVIFGDPDVGELWILTPAVEL
ncbi:hypothetical protein [Streptomyces sp. NPDC050263]|uniref:hypothetical protein n=1 Tax=Streptomyces sp. NPDC050263 TaxID=3155037 RepID=UPI00343390D2